MRTSWLVGMGFVALAATTACGDDADSADGGDGGARESEDGSMLALDGPSAEPSLPPEVELEENFRSPVVSGRYLWSANPDTNRVALIDAQSLDVEVVDGGHAPTFLAALPEGPTPGGALVINVLGMDASVFTWKDGGSESEDEASVDHERVPVQEGASAWAVGQGGKFAIAWSDSKEGLRGTLDGYQDLTVMQFTKDGPVGTKLSVGFRPSKVRINDAETTAYVVAEPGISIIDLTADPPMVAREHFLPEDTSGQSRDVSFTSDGALAFVRLTGSSEVLVIDTVTGEEVTVELPADVTDLDLSGDGSMAVAVMRGEVVGDPGGGEGGQGGAGVYPPSEDAGSQVALLPVPGIFASPEDFGLYGSPELVGSTVVADDASVALLFTNAIENPRLSIMDLSDGSQRVIDLKAPIQGAFINEAGENAVAMMSPPIDSSAKGAFALVPVAEDLPARIEGTNTGLRFVSLEGDRALVTTWGSEASLAETYLGRFPTLTVDRVELPSLPLASGMVPEAKQGFVAQEHTEGRVTFVDLESALPRTVTGFELASKVVE